MTETPSPPQPPPELHRGIAYLREDIQDLRTELRGIHTRIDGVHTRIDGLRGDMTTQIDGLRGDMSAQIDSLRREGTGRFYWTIATMVTLAGVLVAVFKL